MATVRLQQQLTNMTKQRGVAWAKYYEVMRNDATNANIIITMLGVPHNPPKETELPPHITQEFYEMACELRRKFECPCCLEIVNKDNIKITTCGHIYDDACLTLMKAQDDPKCAMCRRKI